MLWDDYFRRLTVENLLKNIEKERNVLKFLNFREARLRVFANLPVVSPNNSVDNLRSPSVSVRIETVSFLLESAFKTMESLAACGISGNALDTLLGKKPQATKEADFEWREYVRHYRNLQTLHKTCGVVRETDEKSKLKEINLKLCVNFLQVKFFGDTPPPKPEPTIVDPAAKNPLQMQVVFTEPKPPLETSPCQGVQMVLETAALDVVLRRMIVA